MSAKADLKSVYDDVLNLKKSPLYAHRCQTASFPVVGSGSSTASVLFIGEAPGKNEAKTGKPFCGASGRLLDQLLEHVHLKRDDVYITNIVKDRPPENRDPTKEEIALYGPFLEKQIEIIKPKMLVTLGRFSMDYILSNYCSHWTVEPISKAHGRLYVGKAPYGKVYILPLYHPAAAIYNQKLKPTLFKDFAILKNFHDTALLEHTN